jgi:hypothetical protein
MPQTCDYRERGRAFALDTDILSYYQELTAGQPPPHQLERVGPPSGNV